MKRDKKNKGNKEPDTRLLGRSVQSGRFAENLTGPKGITKEAFDALASIKLSPRDRDTILDALDSHEKTTGNPQQ